MLDGIYEEVIDNSYQIASALTAGAAPLYPPSGWYQNPNLDRPSPLAVTDDGQVKGHIATWSTNHIGLPHGTRPPHSKSDYAFFKTGVVKTQDGQDVHVGQLTLAGGHAPLSAGAGEAVKHYDDTASAIADVTVGEDAHGIWVSGGLRSTATEEDIRALRASAPSGDWRPVNGNLELVAVCQVNTPGFPIARAMVASGEMTALVAAGAGRLYELQREANTMNSLDSVVERLANLEAVIAAGLKKNSNNSQHADDLTPGDSTNPASALIVLDDQGMDPDANLDIEGGLDPSGAEQITGVAGDPANARTASTAADAGDDDFPEGGRGDDRVTTDAAAANDEGINTPTGTQMHDAQLGGGADGDGDEDDAIAGKAAAAAAATAAEVSSARINGVRQQHTEMKKARLRSQLGTI